MVQSGREDPVVLEACVAVLGPGVTSCAERAFLVQGVPLVGGFELPEAARNAIGRMVKIERLFGPDRWTSGAATSVDVYRTANAEGLHAASVDEGTYWALYDLGVSLYPKAFEVDDASGDELKERRSKYTRVLEPPELDAWMHDHVLPREEFGDTLASGLRVATPRGTRMADERDRALEVWWSALRPGLVSAGTTTVHCLTDENNENTARGVHIVIGGAWVIFLVREWML
jgi:hypothetical protein